MRTIYKYRLETTDQQVIEMPEGAEILTLQVQNGEPHIWALVFPDAMTTKRVFRTYGTGSGVSGYPSTYIGTYQLSGGTLVFHVFEVNY